MMGIAIAALIAGGVVDYISLRMQQRDLQSAADHAALSAAQELVLASNAQTRVQQIAATFVTANYDGKVETTADVIEEGGAVRVRTTAPPRVFFLGPIGANAGPVSVESVAEIMGEEANVCVITLEEDSGKALSLDDSASLDAPTCSIYSNSTDKAGISAKGSSRLKGNLICTAGGREGSLTNYSPDPLLDCPQIIDPLASRPPPPVGACDFNDFVRKDYIGELSPGVYCGGLELTGASDVRLKPGIYVIKDGRFKVDGTAKLEGEGVGFFLTGAKTQFEFTKEASIHLSAPQTGPMAGLLFFEDNTILKETKHKITSDNADYLVGTIYLPRGSFLIDATQDVAAESEFTVLVVRELELKEAPRLVLNTDYGTTSVPLPQGVGDKGPKSVRLVR